MNRFGVWLRSTLLVVAIVMTLVAGTASSAQPQALQASASALGLGDAAFVHYQPPALSGDNGPFDPARNRP